MFPAFQEQQQQQRFQQLEQIQLTIKNKQQQKTSLCLQFWKGWLRIDNLTAYSSVEKSVTFIDDSFFTMY